MDRGFVEVVDYDEVYGDGAARVAGRCGEGGGLAPSLCGSGSAPTPGPSREREGSDLAQPVPLPLAGNRRCAEGTAVRGGHAAGTDAEDTATAHAPSTPATHRRPGPEPLLDAALQARFCDQLAAHGNARLACRAAGVSASAAYRMRRADPVFRRLWDAALIVARDQVEDVLADRAVNGWDEAVFYHGEEVAVRRRYDSRLLLAHLARLDRLAERIDMAGALERFDDDMAALAAGEPLAPVAAPEPALAAAASPAGAEEAGESGVGDSGSGEGGAQHGAGGWAPAPIPLLEAQLQWLEAAFGPLGEEEEAFHLLNTVPGVPGSALRALGWRGPDEELAASCARLRAMAEAAAGLDADEEAGPDADEGPDEGPVAAGPGALAEALAS